MFFLKKNILAFLKQLIKNLDFPKNENVIFMMGISCL